MSKKRIIVTVLNLLTSISLFSQTPKHSNSGLPKLIVGITINGLDNYYLTKYLNRFGERGFAKIFASGLNCKNTKYNYLFSETAIDNTSIYTGTSPRHHGVISKEWYKESNGTIVDCMKDKNYKIIEKSLDKKGVSIQQLLTTTLGDEIKLLYPKSKIISVTLDKKAAVFSSGHSVNGAYWIDNFTGKWVTSSYFLDPLPHWVKKFNSKNFEKLYLNRTWTLLDNITLYKEYNKKNTSKFPYYLKVSGEEMKDFRKLKSSPFGNILIRDFSAAAIVNEDLGKDETPDLLTIQFSLNNEMNYKNNMDKKIGSEDLYARLDLAISSLFSLIDDEIGLKNTLFFIVATDIQKKKTQELKTINIPSKKFNIKGSISLLESYLSAIYATQIDWIVHYDNYQLYLNSKAILEKHLSLSEVRKVTSDFLLQFSGISNVYTKEDLRNGYYEKGEAYLLKNSYNNKRSGDIVFTLQLGWEPSLEEYSKQLSIGNNAPLYWYGWKVPKNTIYREINITDIAPTISAILGIPKPSKCTGNIIKEIFK